MKREVAKKACNMAGIGPISMESVKYFMDRGDNFETSKKLAVKEFLSYNMNYIDEELESLGLKETKLSTKGEDIIYVVMETEEEVKELYMHKAEMHKEEIIVRNYIPPNFHDIFVFFNRICTQKRKDNPSLKMQICFG